MKKRIMIVGHENNLRSIIKRLHGISDDAITHIERGYLVPSDGSEMKSEENLKGYSNPVFLTETGTRVVI